MPFEGSKKRLIGLSVGFLKYMLKVSYWLVIMNTEEKGDPFHGDGL
jgi:hypothetical protein